jgi:geranylgeranyl pyrophosphate synthase
MRYSTLAGGKRVRPILVYTTGEALGAPLEMLDAAAAAVELIHVYSLVHDDLPAMDDDDLRRGRPTCHRAYDEATAILTGDALQARAFEVLAQAPAAIPPNARIEMLRLLADAIGTRGMAGGQAIDLEAVQKTLTITELERMHRQKTGALIQASVMLGALSAGLSDVPERAASFTSGCWNTAVLTVARAGAIWLATNLLQMSS